MKTKQLSHSKGLLYRLWSIILIASAFLIFSSLSNLFPQLWEWLGLSTEAKAVLTIGMVLILLISLSRFVRIERSPSSPNPSLEKSKEEYQPPIISSKNTKFNVNSDVDQISRYYNDMILELQKKLAQVDQYSKSLADANESLARVAAKDGLTGLYNQSFAKERLQQEIYRTERYKRSLSLLMIDLDDFKTLNDKYGHVVGDRVLKTLARLMVEIIRPSDIPARYGGEEFLIILPETIGENAVKVADRIRKRIEAYPFEINHTRDRTCQVTISIGVCSYPDYGRTSEDLITLADAALYGAKREGKNRVVVYNE